MDGSLYLAMSAAKQDMMRQGIASQNLANANTAGFKADQAEFKSLYAQGVGQNDTVFTQLETLATDTARGTYKTTGLDRDISVKDDFWLSVKLPDGTEGYVSTATTNRDASGTLITSHGYPLIGESGSIKIPSEGTYRFSPNGEIKFNDGSGVTSTIDRLKVVSASSSELVKSSYGVLTMQEGTASPASNDSDYVLPGVIESSNVNSMMIMTEVLEISKSYQNQINMMNAAKSLDRSATSLLRME